MDAAPAADNEPLDAATTAAATPRSLSHRVLVGGVWSLAGRIGSMGSLFLLHVVLARSLEKSDFAGFLAASSVVPPLAMLATVGVPMTLIRVLRGAADGGLRREALRGAMTLTAIGGAVTALGYGLTAGLIPDDAKWQVLRDAPGFLGAWFVMSALCMVAASYLQAEDHFRAAALVGARSGGLVPNMVALLTALVVAAAGLLTLNAVLLVQLLAYSTALTLAGWFILRSFRQPVARPVTAGQQPRAGDKHTALWYFRESWPNLLNQLIAVALTELDLLWITYLSSEDTVAKYGVIRDLRLLVAAPLLVASVALPPFVAELYARGELARLERLVRGAATALSLPALAALAVLLVAPATVIRVIYGEDFVTASSALQILSLGAVVFVLSGSNAMTLTMVGRHRDLLACTVSGLAFYLLISPPLVSRYGVVGAAVAFTLQTIALNVAVTLRVKQTVGIWTIPLLSWSALREEADFVLRRLKVQR